MLQKINTLKPYLSLIIINSILFGIVFLKMDELRREYSLLKLNREYKKIIDQRRIKEYQLAQAMRPQIIEFKANENKNLKKPLKQQIIHIAGTFSSDTLVK